MINWFFDHVDAITGAALCLSPIVFGGLIGALCSTGRKPEAIDLEGFPNDGKQTSQTDFEKN